jgi:hypothetical protein
MTHARASGTNAQCLIADADAIKFRILLYKANGDEFSMKFAIWAPKKCQNGKNQ